MAIRTQRLASAENDAVFVEVDYSDVNPGQNMATLARWSNTLPKPANIKVTLNNGKVIVDSTLPIGGQPGSSGEFVLAGADRFNVTVETQTPAVNLAPWSTSTVP